MSQYIDIDAYMQSHCNFNSYHSSYYYDNNIFRTFLHFVERGNWSGRRVLSILYIIIVRFKKIL